jgi:broad specificity phosphatase PhoE
VSLTEKRFSDAEYAKALLEDISFNKIYCSDLLRARQTCEIALPGRAYEIDPLLREINVGNLIGLTAQEVRKIHGNHHKAIADNSDFTFFGGENRQMQLERTQKFLWKLEEIITNGNIAVFTHYGVINCVLWYVLGFPFDFKRTTLDNGSCSVFHWSGEHWSFLKWNITSTLRRTTTNIQ